jgi:very-short-patch-repair endonuclease
MRITYFRAKKLVGIDLYNINSLKVIRRYLRNNSTETERILWSVLKDKKLDGRKFRRQFSIGYYIADFYCPSEKLIIELDGPHHYLQEGIKRDLERDEHLELFGIKVLRFENSEVKSNLTNVLKTIKANFTVK